MRVGLWLPLQVTGTVEGKAWPLLSKMVLRRTRVTLSTEHWRLVERRMSEQKEQCEPSPTSLPPLPT